MSGPDFLDTNVLVSAYDASEPIKQRTAQELVRRAVAGEMVTSTQVLAEFAVTLLHKLSPAARPADVLTILDALGSSKSITLPVLRCLGSTCLYRKETSEWAGIERFLTKCMALGDFW
jgi:predicted nucleic acid-binding protein